MPNSSNPAEILREAKVKVSAETYTLVSVDQSNFSRIMENPELSPRMTSPFMIFSDTFEVTLLLDETDFSTMRHALRDARIERGFRMLTFDTILDLTVVGFLYRITEILNDASISVVVLSAFSHDHVLVKQNDLARALKYLGPHVAELC